MFNKTALKIELVRADKTLQELADYLGISYTTLYRKLNGETEFTRSEIQNICEFLNIEDPVPIFFANVVA